MSYTISNFAAEKKPQWNPERIQLNILASAEKRTLIWIAKRLPDRIHSDHLTILGLLGMLFTGISYALAPWIGIAAPLLATFFLFVNWFGDSLDGTVARVRNRQRPRYGFYVDHVIDTVGFLFLMGGLALSGYMSPWVAAGVLISYYLLCIDIYLATSVLKEFKMSFGFMGPTELRIVLVVGNVFLLFYSKVYLFGKEFPVFDAGAIPAIAILAGLAIHSMIRNTIRLYRMERLPERKC